MSDPVKGHILVVEPNDITRKLIVGILNNNGYNTYEAVNGTEATTFLAKPLQLVILNAEEENVENVGFIRKMQMEYSKLPLIAMTEGEEAASVEARLNLSQVSVMAKPVMPDKLLKNIQGHLMQGSERKIETEQQKTAERKAASPVPDSNDPKATNDRENHMRKAIDISQEKMDANCGGPFGAVIVKQGRIIAEGWNEVTSSNDPTAHAEMQAIRKATKALGDYSLSGCEIYTSCEPCPMCLAAIYWARIDRIYYANTREDAEKIGFDDDFIYRELAQPEHKRTLPSRMILHAEAQIVFANWMKKTDKTPY